VFPTVGPMRDQLAVNGEPPARGGRDHPMRAGEYVVSNPEASALLKTLKSERQPPPTRRERESPQAHVNGPTTALT
jgi:hypothetical protein